MQIEKINFNEQQLAIIVYDNFAQSGIHFFTSNELSQQLAFMNHPKGKQIDPHVHNPIKREVLYTQEVLFIKSGKLRVDFYSDTQVFLESRVLSRGDVILLMTGGHGFEVLEDLQMFEVKQGPYAGDEDKTRFLKK
jgi:mannose-6-phosphate isomerase-like protein (cupin superfamily)